MSFLRVENIYAGYGKKEVLRDVSIYLDKGEIVALIGPNGAGKSTLLKVIAGFLIPYNGKVIFEDVDITYLPSFKRVLLGLLYLMQGGRIFPNLTVKENLELSITSNISGGRIEEVLTIFPELRSVLRRRAGLLSGGQKQQLAISMILLKRPRIILLDEPSAGLSPYLVSEIIEKIKEINRVYGTSIILVEQNVTQALKVSNRVYILSNGMIVNESKDPMELLEGETLEKIFFGEIKKEIKDEG